MTLGEYLRKHKLTDQRFGELADLSQPFVNRLRRGKAKPSYETIEKIVKATGGKVAPSDLFTETPEAERAA